jgi:hypothetical protein
MTHIVVDIYVVEAQYGSPDTRPPLFVDEFPTSGADGPCPIRAPVLSLVHPYKR